MMVEQSQTKEGVTLTINWVYLDIHHLLVGIQSSKLPDNIVVGFPTVLVNGQLIGEDQKESKYLRNVIPPKQFTCPIR